jgi:hypothetical protein
VEGNGEKNDGQHQAQPYSQVFTFLRWHYLVYCQTTILFSVQSATVSTLIHHIQVGLKEALVPVVSGANNANTGSKPFLAE